MFKTYTTLFLIIYLLKDINTEKCSNAIRTHENYLGSLTPYRIVGNNTFGKIEYKGCNAVKLWMLVRHGTRYPKAKLIEEMTSRLPTLRDIIIEHNTKSNEFLYNSDLQAFKKWEIKLANTDKMKLTHEGEEEMLNISERMQSRFPSLLSNIYSNTSYLFKYSYSQRTRKSAHYFARGLFGRDTAKFVWYPEPLKKDPILRFYKLCSKWLKLKKSSKVKSYKEEFLNSGIMTETVKRINKRLNLTSNTLGRDDVHLIYLTCSYETAWRKSHKSPWCSIFSVDDLKVFEYMEDLKYYWQDGYGHELTYKQSCVAFEDLFDFFKSKKAYPKSVLYFTHSGTLLKVLTYLQLYKEGEHLSLKNFNEKMNNRNWRTSVIDTFATNLAFVLHNCNGIQKVLTLHQEKIIRLPSCPDTDLCELSKISDFYRSDSCNFDEMCENDLDSTDEFEE